MGVTSIAKSGLRVGEAMAVAAASNVANSHDIGTIPAVTAVDGVTAPVAYPYQPIRAIATAQPGDGATVVTVEQTGEADINADLIGLIETQTLYTANAAVLKADRRIQSSLDLTA